MTPAPNQPEDRTIKTDNYRRKWLSLILMAARSRPDVNARRVGRLLAAVLVTLLAILAWTGSGPAGARKHRARSATTSPTSAPASIAPVTTRFATLATAAARPTTTSSATSAKAPTTSGSTRVSTRPASNRSDPRLARIGFRSAQRLHDHFLKHGAEFGSITEAEYLGMAQALRDAPLSGQVLEATQADGSISRFDRTTGAFMAFDTDLTIRTFFKPGDGEAYFRRAAKRSH